MNIAVFELNLYLCEDHNKITISRNVSMVTYIIRSPLTFNLFHYHNKKLVALTKCDKYRPYVDYKLQEWIIMYMGLCFKMQCTIAIGQYLFNYFAMSIANYIVNSDLVGNQ